MGGRKADIIAGVGADVGSRATRRRGVLSARDAARALGVHERTIRRAIERGALAATKHGRSYQITATALARYRPRQHRRSDRPVAVDRAGAPPWATSLPISLTPLIGREHDAATVCSLLRGEAGHAPEEQERQAGARLLTLTGPGGVGKTRLALHVAETVRTEFADGVAFVPLAPVRDPALVAPTIAQTLGIREPPDRPLVAALQDSLRDRRLLLLLDNFEHVVEAAPLLPELLAACPHLTLLVTSRARLRVSGERDLAVPPLTLPNRDAPEAWPSPSVTATAEAAAVRLFVDRAQAVNAAFRLTDDNTAAVAAICHRLDGLPLAIELAAARMNLLPPPVLLARLEPRLPLLVAGARDAPARLQTMRDAIAWSYDLLTLEEQTLFRRLAVFVGGFSLDAISSAEPGGLPPGSALDLLASLLDKSLLTTQHEGTPSGLGIRYSMLETIREFGLEQLAASGEETVARDAHAGYALALAAAAELRLVGPDQVAWLDLLELELPNLRAALDWLREQGRVEEGLRLAAAPGRFWWRRGYLSEGRAWLEAFLALPVDGASQPARVRALIVAGDLAAWQKDNDQARARHGEAADLARALGDAWGLAMALFGLGSDAVDRNELARAEPLLAESVAHFRALGDAWGAALARSRQGIVALAQGDHARAAAYSEEALTVFRDQQDWRYVAGVLDQVALVALAQGDLVGARRANAEALSLSAALGDKTGIAWGLEGMAGVATLTGQDESAARLLGAAAALRAALGARLGPVERAHHDRVETEARGALGAAAFASAWERGAALPLADAVAEATALADNAADGEAGAAASDIQAPSELPRLTPRELEVLRLLADGKSDREIAAVLTIAIRTASTHVSSILAKLGVPSRAAAVAYAIRHRLV